MKQTLAFLLIASLALGPSSAFALRQTGLEESPEELEKLTLALQDPDAIPKAASRLAQLVTSSSPVQSLHPVNGLIRTRGDLKPGMLLVRQDDGERYQVSFVGGSGPVWLSKMVDSGIPQDAQSLEFSEVQRAFRVPDASGLEEGTKRAWEWLVDNVYDSPEETWETIDNLRPRLFRSGKRVPLILHDRSSAGLGNVQLSPGVEKEKVLSLLQEVADRSNPPGKIKLQIWSPQEGRFAISAAPVRERGGRRAKSPSPESGLEEVPSEVKELVRFRGYTLEPKGPLIPMKLDAEKVSQITAWAVSPDKKRVALAHGDGVIRIWGVQGKDVLAFLKEGISRAPVPSPGLSRRLAHTKPIQALAFDPNGWILYSGDLNGNLFQWVVLGNETRGVLRQAWEQLANGIVMLAVSSSGEMIASAGPDGGIFVHTLQEKDVANAGSFVTRKWFVRRPSAPKAPLKNMAFGKDGRTIEVIYSNDSKEALKIPEDVFAAAGLEEERILSAGEAVEWIKELLLGEKILSVNIKASAPIGLELGLEDYLGKWDDDLQAHIAGKLQLIEEQGFKSFKVVFNEKEAVVTVEGALEGAVTAIQPAKERSSLRREDLAVGMTLRDPESGEGWEVTDFSPVVGGSIFLRSLSGGQREGRWVPAQEFKLNQIRRFVIGLAGLEETAKAAAERKRVAELTVDGVAAQVKAMADGRESAALIIHQTLLPTNLNWLELSRVAESLNKLQGFPTVRIDRFDLFDSLTEEAKAQYWGKGTRLVCLTPGPPPAGTDGRNRDTIYVMRPAEYETDPIPLDLLPLLVTQALGIWKREQDSPSGRYLQLPVGDYFTEMKGLTEEMIWEILRSKFV